MFDIEQFPKRLREFRMLKGLSQKELAEMADLTPASLSAYEKENGAKGSKTPTLSTAVKLAEQLGVSIDWLCGKEEEKKDTITNYADLLSAIINITKRVETYITLEEEDFSDKKYPKILIRDENLSYFFSEWAKLKRLFEAGTIDRDLYELWINKQLGIYEYTSLGLLKRYQEIDLEALGFFPDEEETKEDNDIEEKEE